MIRPSNRMKILRSFIAAIAVMFAAAFASPGAQAQQTLRISANTPVGTLDPVKMRLGALEYNYAFLVFSRLAFFDEDLNVVPDLAERWESSPDQKVWTFHLRKGAKFHNGREVEAEDVVAVFNRNLEPANGSLIRGSLAILQKAEVVDKHTVRFTLSIPYSAWPAITANFQTSIVPRDAVDTLTTKPIGTGAYQFVDYQPGGALNLAKNPDYFLPGQPKIEKVSFRIIPDFNTAVAALERGEIDLVWGLQPEHVDVVSKSKNAKVSEVASGSWMRLGMNHEMPPFDNPKVRQAVAKLLDKEMMTEVAMFGRAAVALTPIPTTHAFFNKAIGVPKPDPEGAKKLLAEAGYPNGLTISITTAAKQPVRERIAVAFREMAKKGGMNVEVNLVPEDQYRSDKYPLTIGSYNGRAVPDLMVYDWYHSTGAWNRTSIRFKSPEVDKVLDEARQTSDPAKQKELYLKFQELIVANDPAPVLFILKSAVGVSNRVENFTASKHVIMDVRNTTLKPGS
jgi:peptide/nickel transport system substrate-binding protein